MLCFLAAIYISIWLSTWNKVLFVSEKTYCAYCLRIKFAFMVKWNWSAIDCCRPLIICFSLRISDCSFSIVYIYTQRDSRSAQRKHSDFRNPISYSCKHWITLLLTLIHHSNLYAKPRFCIHSIGLFVNNVLFLCVEYTPFLWPWHLSSYVWTPWSRTST